MIDLAVLPAAIGFAVGIAAAALHLAMLRASLGRHTFAPGQARRLGLQALLRLALVAAAFLIVTPLGAPALVAALAGYLTMRGVALRRVARRLEREAEP